MISKTLLTFSCCSTLWTHCDESLVSNQVDEYNTRSDAGSVGTYRGLPDVFLLASFQESCHHLRIAWVHASKTSAAAQDPCAKSLPMSDEKRKHGRLPLVIEALWDGSTGKSQARTTDLSEGGCFVDTTGQVAVGETLNFRLKSPAGKFISVRAEVIYQLPGFGFGVRFTEISDADRKQLHALLNPKD
jgi:hypothetical protein